MATNGPIEFHGPISEEFQAWMKALTRNFQKLGGTLAGFPGLEECLRLTFYSGAHAFMLADAMDRGIEAALEIRAVIESLQTPPAGESAPDWKN